MRKSAERETELATIAGELSRLSRPTPAYVAIGEKILELAKTAHCRYLEQDPTEQRRLLDAVLSNTTFDRGTLCPTYVKPFDLLARCRETGNWRRGWDSNRAKTLPSTTYGNWETLKPPETPETSRVGTIQERQSDATTSAGGLERQLEM